VAQVLPQAASDFYRTQQRLVVSMLSLARSQWAGMGDDLDGSWARVGPRLVRLTTAAQVGAARNATAYVPAVLAQQGIDITPDGAVDPTAFGGYASDGRPLDSLLYGAVIESRTVQADSLSQRLSAGGRWLDMAIQTQVADAGRQATGIGVALRQRTGWVRMVNPPCCQRCAVLAGRVYRYSQGFQRHPHCDCQMVPTLLVGDNPPGVTIGPGDVKDLTAAQRQAIADGSDVNKVINSHRAGKRNGMTTTEGARRGQKRLTPEGIYKIASDRTEALRLLTAHGYLL
jgi:hypothetical protein